MNELVIKINEQLEFHKLNDYDDFIFLTELWKRHSPVNKDGKQDKSY